ncbi:carboxylesterase family protein [Rathayibacter sp. YIM 133350]|uniref:carboxylesterase/lipase family protein n=1 Tax=Rathayibacter sp. YIM 133350 TaxID=3131992 RepID=UPI00307F86B9
MTQTEDLVEVATAAGRVRGRWRSGPGDAARSAAFLGIPFAEPPVGDLRFAAPVSHRPWDGIRDALEYGATPQRGTADAPTIIPEPSVPGSSTLNLNVFTPRPTTADAGLPVLVYIHGGGYTAGSPASPWYDGAAFNRDGVVTVTISYRLGFDGFGAIPDAPANRAVLDWLLALEWVRDNIRSFGGDPQRVTIAGQSAGGSAVLTLLGMERAQSLFSAVYAISAPPADIAATDARAASERMAAAAGVPNTLAGFAGVDEQRLLEIQKKIGEPVAGTNPLDIMRSMLDEGLPWAPVVDGDLITRPTLDAIRAGVGADKPLVLGANDDEFSMILTSAAGKLRFVPAGLILGKAGMPKAARRAYLAANRDLPGTARIVGRYITDRMFRAYALAIAEARAAAAEAGGAAAGTWLYRFSWFSPVYGLAVHCLDVPFFFDCLDADGVEALAGGHPPQQLADEMHAAAVGFVRSGDPGWRAFDGESEAARVFDVPASTLDRALEATRALV